MWTGVIIVAAVFDFEFSESATEALDAATENPTPVGFKLQFAALVTSFSYIGSIGAEALIRYSDEFKWSWPFSKNPSGIATGQLFVCLSFTILLMLIVGVTEVSDRMFSFPFTASALEITDLFTDPKFMLVLGVGLLFRAYIYRASGQPQNV